MQSKMISGGLTRTVVAVVLAAAFPSIGDAACNMGEDAGNITELSFGQFKLYGFPAGSLRVSGQHALPNFDSWPFSLRTPNNQIGVSFTAAGSVMSSPLTFNATMQMTKPITGYIIERITSDGCLRELRVEDNALTDNSLRFISGTLGNSFGGKIPLTGLNLRVDYQENLSDRRGQTRGFFLLRGQNIKITGAQIRIPANDKFPTTVNLTSDPGMEVTFGLPVATLNARVRFGAFTTDPLSTEVGTIPANWDKVFLWGEMAQSAKIEDLRQASVPGGTRLSFRIAGSRPRPMDQTEVDPASVKVLSCYKNGAVGSKRITIEQMHDCSGLWVTPRALLNCAKEAHCSVLSDTLEGRATLDAVLAAEHLTLDAPLNLPEDALHLPPMPARAEIQRCKNEAGSRDAFMACIKPTIGGKYGKMRACFEAVTEGERLACFAKEANDARFTNLVRCSAGGEPSVDKLFTCIVPREELSRADEIRKCVNLASTPEARRACITATFGANERQIVNCALQRRGSEALACLDPLSPDLARVRTVAGCLTTGASTPQALACLGPVVGSDAATVAGCVANRDRKAAVICLLGDRPQVRSALQAYNCVSGGRDASSIIANCTDGIIGDQKTREALACVSRAGGERTQLASCAAAAVLPADAARLVACATNSQGASSVRRGPCNE
jgi:hypothetical protein